MIEISTSILTVELDNSMQTFYNLEVAKTDYFHIDVMDGRFVEANTAEMMLGYAENIKSISNLPLDVHLMVESPKEYIDEFIPLEPCFITIHEEAFSNKQDFEDTIKYVKNQGIKVGVSIKPDTPVDVLYGILDKINLVLVMTVEPGKGRTKFNS